MYNVCGNSPPGTLQTLCVRAGGISDYFFIYTEQLHICHFRE